MKPLTYAMLTLLLGCGCGEKTDKPKEKKTPKVRPQPRRVAPTTVKVCGKQLDPQTAKKVFCRSVSVVRASELKRFAKLRLLDVSSAERIVGLDGLAGHAALRELAVFNTPVDPKAVAKLTQLEELRVVRPKATTDLAPLVALTRLKYLRCSHCGLRDITFLAKLTALHSLSLSHSPAIAKFQVIGGLTKLRYLNLSGTRVADLKWIKGLTQLASLSLAATRVADLRPLSGLTQLRDLNLASTAVRDLRPLLLLKNLDRLDLRDTRRLRNLAPLRRMAWLKVLVVPKTTPATTLQRLQKSLPRTQVRAR